MSFINKDISKGLKPTQILVVGFFIIIMLGTTLLMLPISTVDGESTSFVDSLFTATSAVCVTGLIIHDTGTYWSVFGKTVILFLIQIGGLGFMTMGTTIAIVLGKKISLRNRIIMQEALNQFSISGVIRLTRDIFLLTLGIELFGALFLAIRFVPSYGLKNGIYYSIFHSISAFCNAGFDIMGNGVGLTGFVDDPLIVITVVSLIILGGLGFFVIADVLRVKKFKQLSLHSKLAISMTGILILIGIIIVYIFEFRNPETLGGLTARGKLLAAIFHSVTPRTAGFNTVNMASLTLPTVMYTMIFMFIGGSPGSTAGGVKTTTVGMIFLKVKSVIEGKDDVEFAHKRISHETINRAFAVFIISGFIVIGVTSILAITEANRSLEMILFETISAFGTVGLSLGLTSELSSIGKIIISMTMFFGRLGPLTIALALSNRVYSKKQFIRYPEGKIMVG